MILLLSEISKYLILLLMALYTCLNFAALRRGRPGYRDGLCRKLMFMTCLQMFFGGFILILNTGDLSIAAMLLLQLFVSLLYRSIYRKLYPQASQVLVCNMLMLFSIGMLMLARLSVARAWRQLLYWLPALLITLLVPFFISRLRILARWGLLYALAGIGLLGVVWVAGETTYGAQLSLSLGPLTVQPSEFVKILFVFFTAGMLYRKQSFPRIVFTTILAAAHVLLLVASTDLGSGLVFFMAYLFMLYVASGRAFYLFSGLGAGAGASVLAYKLFRHVRVRVLMWRDPFSDYENMGYQLAQSLLAIGTGGWFGVGLCRGIPGSIPKSYNDYIFAAICEELGGIFGILLLLIYLGFLLQMFRVALHMEDSFYKIVGVGMASMIGFQTFLHVGGVIRMIPATGITLPLISYGGTSLLSTAILLAVIQGLYVLEGRAQAAAGKTPLEDEDDALDEPVDEDELMVLNERLYGQDYYEEDLKREMPLPQIRPLDPEDIL